jgi:hypothetical protein
MIIEKQVPKERISSVLVLTGLSRCYSNIQNTPAVSIFWLAGMYVSEI